MIDLFDLYEETCATVNTVQGGHIRPHRNFTKWVNTISMDLFKEFYREFETSQVIPDELDIFLRSTNMIVTPTPGQMFDVVKFPDEYKFFASARLRTYQNRCYANPSMEVAIMGDKVMDEDERQQYLLEADQLISEIGITKKTNNRWEALTSRKTFRPSLTDPYCTQFDGGLKIAPKNTGMIVVDYFRLPPDATFEYTIIGEGTEDEYIQYNATTSRKLEWANTMRPRFIAALKAKYGDMVANQSLYEHGTIEGRK